MVEFLLNYTRDTVDNHLVQMRADDALSLVFMNDSHSV